MKLLPDVNKGFFFYCQHDSHPDCSAILVNLTTGAALNMVLYKYGTSNDCSFGTDNWLFYDSTLGIIYILFDQQSSSDTRFWILNSADLSINLTATISSFVFESEMMINSGTVLLFGGVSNTNSSNLILTTVDYQTLLPSTIISFTIQTNISANITSWFTNSTTSSYVSATT